MSAKRRATSQDVAAMAGVSRATVSYVLNENPTQSIPPETRRRVWEAADALGYTPNAAARALRRGRSHLVLFAVRNIPYGRNLGLVVDRLAGQVASRGLSLVTWQATGEQTLRETLEHLQPRLVLSMFPLGEGETAALRAARIPCAALESLAGVSGGDELAGSIMAHHLAERGHTRIAFLNASDPDLRAFAGPRALGVRRGCVELGLSAPQEAALPAPPHGDEAGVRAVLERWRSGPEAVTGVACYNDYFAAQLLRAARQLGLGVPADLGVVGVDDDPMSALLDPPLTTVRLDMVAMADQLLARGLAQLGEGEAPPVLSSSVTHLVARAST